MKKIFLFLANIFLIINAAIADLPLHSKNSINEIDPCNCWIERDVSWSVVPFTNGVAPQYRNDDGLTLPIALPFNFCFYGTNYDTIYISNNGCVSLDGQYVSSVPDSFPFPSIKLIAPFWSDVDTRSIMSGLVYYKLTNSSLQVQWDHVGYYNTLADKLNTFQLILTDGLDSILDAGKNVAFCYKDMQWATAYSSGGPVSGFGGTPATVGANSNDSLTHSIQIGRFDQSGPTYFGPYGGPGGIDFLDNQSYSFDLCSSSNISPFVKYSELCDTFEICMGDTTAIEFEFYSPEAGQVTTSAFNFYGLTGCGVLQNIPGNVATATAYVIGQTGNLGYHTIDVTATDNGIPQQSFAVSFVIYVKNVDATFTYSPTTIQIGDTVTYTANSTDNDVDIWYFGDGSPLDSGLSVTHTYVISSLFNVRHTVRNSHCLQVTSQQQISVLPVGVSELNSSLNASLSPNPTNGILVLTALDLSSNFTIQISDVQGRIVFERNNVRTNGQIDINELEKGIYFYRISNDKGERKGQVIKE